MKTSVTASSARVGLLLIVLATLAWPAQAQNANLAILGADPGPLQVQDLTCTCGDTDPFTSMTLRYEKLTVGTVTIDGTDHTSSSYGNQFSFTPSGSTIEVATPPSSSATVPSNGGATTGLLRSLHAGLRVIAYTCDSGTVCKLEADPECTGASFSPNAPGPNTLVTITGTFENDHSLVTNGGNITNGTVTFSFPDGSFDVTSVGTLPGGVSVTSGGVGMDSPIVFTLAILNDGSPITLKPQLTVENKPNPIDATATFTISGDLPDPGSSSKTCPVDFVNLPVELVSFDAQVDGRGATLRWETASETNNAGFEVQHRYADATNKIESEFEALGWIEGAGTTLEAQSYNYRLDNLDPGLHVFRLKQIDFDGTFEYSPQIEVAIEMPEAFLVSNIYPNPFNPQASFSFGVKQAQQVSIELFNVLGQRVRELYQGTPAAGVTQTIQIDGSGLQSGVYLLRVLGERFVDTQMITLIK